MFYNIPPFGPRSINWIQLSLPHCPKNDSGSFFWTSLLFKQERGQIHIDSKRHRPVCSFITISCSSHSIFLPIKAEYIYRILIKWNFEWLRFSSNRTIGTSAKRGNWINISTPSLHHIKVTMRGSLKKKSHKEKKERKDNTYSI